MFHKYLISGSAPVLFLSLALPFSMAAADVALPGVSNFHKVDEHVYRGAQPTGEGFRNLAKLGVRTVIDLQEPGSRSLLESNLVTSAGMQYVSVPMKEKATPIDENVAKVLRLLEDDAAGPVFVHCHQGADRTGGIIACYRIDHDHWRNDRALSEARSLGMHWDQFAIQRYVKAFSAAVLGLPAVVAAGAVVR